VLPKEVEVTRRSILEYTQALQSRYFGSSKEEKGKILDEFTQVSGLHPPEAGYQVIESEKPAPGKQATWSAT
jgi:hypothetical protein